MRATPVRTVVAACASAAVLAASGVAAAVTAHAAAAGCAVTYTVSTQWSGGFGADVNVTNLGDPVTHWTLTWSFDAGQTITQLWSGSYTQSGAQVRVANAAWNGSIGTSGSAAFGFNGTWNNSTNPVPTVFALNGTTCTGGATGSPSPVQSPSTAPSSSRPSSPPPSPSPPGGALPSSFRWSSTGPLVTPHSDATHSLTGIKDPSVVYYNGKYHVLASTTNAGGSYSMVYLSFADWSHADSATQYYLDQTPIGSGYKTAPMVFYFAPQSRWYLVFQTGGNAAYSTNSDISNPAGWSAPKNFYAGEPAIIQQNIGSGYWVDMWVICDTANCYLFSMDDNGHLYRSQTSVANFPAGMTDPVIALQDTDRHNLFEAENVYKVQGTNQYLLVVECIGAGGKRYFRSFTSTTINGTWTPLAATEANPFAGASNVTFSGTAWTTDISSGEMIRSGYDQTATVNPCKLQYAYQGRDPSVSTSSYSTLPWRIALLTQTNSTC